MTMSKSRFPASCVLEHPDASLQAPSPALYNASPQLPFLPIPSHFQHQQWRYLTTERRKWLVCELEDTIKYTAYFWAIFICMGAATCDVNQEILESRKREPWRVDLVPLPATATMGLVATMVCGLAAGLGFLVPGWPQEQHQHQHQ
ncbi:hypothetical protein LA080_003425 [Diaporthe eres]|nr:hypothetical protein LA080_003425 [Diaporthe eres]